MAGDWIKMRCDLQKHPKVRGIASAICPQSVPDKFRAIGALHAVWSLFDAHSVDGSLRYYTPESLDAEVGVPGIARAMEAVAWLTVGADRLSLPEFDEHNGQSAKRRAEDQKRKRNDRRVRIESASEADTTRTREEKRREEKNPSIKRARAIALPFQPGDSVKRWAAEKFPMVDFDGEVEAFVDHHTATGSVFRDWDAALRKWIRNAAKWNRGATATKPSAKRAATELYHEPQGDPAQLRRDEIREAAGRIQIRVRLDEATAAEREYLAWLCNEHGVMREDALSFVDWQAAQVTA